ncbi:ankyrin repeat-containing domain protein [Nemania sp. FL0916]|nr:ankyrin repeat-containing domain protein [Nemania sp. FL0916]
MADSKGRTALDLSVEVEANEEIRMLLERDTKPLPEAKAIAILRWAVEEGADVLVDRLLDQHVDGESGTPNYGQRTLERAMECSYHDARITLDILLRKEVNFSRETRQKAFLLAAKIATPSTLREMGAKVADVNGAVGDQTALFAAVEEIEKVNEGNRENIEALLKMGADPNLQINDTTALALAEASDNWDAMSVLIDEGADTKESDSDSLLLRCLLKFEKDYYGRDMWFHDKCTCQKYIDEGCRNVSNCGRIRAVKDHRLKLSNVLAKLVKKIGNEINKVDSDGRTALHLAVDMRQWKLVTRLVRKGADMGMKDGKGQTPRDIADATGNLQAYHHAVERGLAA